MSPAESPLRNHPRAPTAEAEALGLGEAPVDAMATDPQQQLSSGSSQQASTPSQTAEPPGGADKTQENEDDGEQGQQQAPLEVVDVAAMEEAEEQPQQGHAAVPSAPPMSPVRGGTAVKGEAERKEEEERKAEVDDEVTVVTPAAASAPAPAPAPKSDVPCIPTGDAHVTKSAPGVLQFTVALDAPLLLDADAPLLDLPENPDPRAEAIAEQLHIASTDGDRLKVYSAWVTDARGCGWRLMYYPYGNLPKHPHNTPRSFKAAVYLEMRPKDMAVPGEATPKVKPEAEEGGGVWDAEDEAEEEEEEPYCRRFVRFSLSPRHFGEGAASEAAVDKISQSVKFEFTSQYRDQGYPHFISGETMRRDPLYLRDGRLLVDVTIEDLPGFQRTENYDSRKEIGLVGLRNQGATCYMNSLLQFLWSVRELRRAVYAMPTEGEEKNNSVALELQRVFYRLQTAPRAVSTESLTKSFGWGMADSFVQHDVQELNRVLCDRLEEKMKGTVADGAVKALFAGRIRHTIRCLNVDYASSREEEYYDVQLDVKGCKGLVESLEAYVRPERMDGDNQYAAEGHGRQDAERYTRFVEYPPMLMLHLKRFEYDFSTMNMQKVHQRFEFPTTADLAPYLDGPEAEAREPRDAPVNYRLHAVFVHSGEVSSGHYYAYVRQAAQPEGSDGWCRFDDETVVAVEEAEVLEDGFGPSKPPTASKSGFGGGGGGGLSLLTKSAGSTSAYMLVYVRESEWGRVMRPLQGAADLPLALAARFERERAEVERRRKEERERNLYLEVALFGPRAVERHTRLQLKADWAPLPPAKALERGQEAAARAQGRALVKLRKTEPVAALMLRARDALGIPLHRQRLWVMISRENKTVRMHEPVLMPEAEGSQGAGDGEGKEREKEREREGEHPPLADLLCPVTTLADGCNTDGIPCVFVEDAAWTAWSGAGEGDGDGMEVVQEEAAAAPAAGEGASKRPRLTVEAGEGEEGQEAGGEGFSGPKKLKTEGGAATAGGAGLGGQEEMAAGAKTTADVKTFLEAFPPSAPPAGHALLFFKRYDPTASLPPQCGPEADEAAAAAAAAGRAGPLTFLFARYVPVSLTAREALAHVRAREAGALDGWLPQGEEGALMYEQVHTGRVVRMHPPLPPKEPAAATAAAAAGSPRGAQGREQEEKEAAEAPAWEPPTLEDVEVGTGDIIILQPDPAAPAQPSPGGSPSTREWKAIEGVLNTGYLPARVPQFVRFLLQRRVFRVRPLGPAEKELLQCCAASPRAAQEGAPGRSYLVRDDSGSGQATELVIEVLDDSPYAAFQRALHRFLRHGGLVDAGRLRLLGCAPNDPAFPSPKFRPVPTADELLVRKHPNVNPLDNSLVTPTAALYASLGDRGPHREEHAFFEVLPFSLHDLREGWDVQDVVVHDARLRRRVLERGLVNWGAVDEEFGRGAEETRGNEMVNMVDSDDEDEEGGPTAAAAAAAAAIASAALGSNGDGGAAATAAAAAALQQLPPGLPVGRRAARSRTLKGVWTAFVPAPAPAEGEEEEEDGKEPAPRLPEPLVLSLLTGPGTTVRDVLKACGEALGLAEGDGVPGPGRLELLYVRDGVLEHVLDPSWRPEKEMVGSIMTARRKPQAHPTARTERVVLHWVDAEEEAPFAARAGEGVSLAAELQQEDGGGEGTGGGGPGAPRYTESLLVQVNFLNVTNPDTAQPPQPGEPPVYRPLNSLPAGLPLLVNVTRQDTRESVMARIAAKVGRPVAVLEERWAPALEVRSASQGSYGPGIFPLPLTPPPATATATNTDNAAAAVDVEEEEDEEKKPTTFVGALLAHRKNHRRVRLFRGVDRQDGFADNGQTPPAIVFYHAEPVGMAPRDPRGTQRIAPRKVSTGIRIREG